ncbi:SsgA family sporulation/cell division regulator [Streptomyces sp. NWU339]|uniref:SsgA family sporulation/cell division regulator n=1 Tax=Streptomyces sp. NWU339 TaxID=2185284 RepID=UPI000D67823F|nr:SsgA family sporulation/cell division regulator [Streptomyces sp. NWU339]PWI05516.1 SsgA family sporulation/cell division regulator [Streptomyces sp. NWU339]
MKNFVEQECEMRLLVAPGCSIGVATRLSYDPRDPYAVHVDFHTGLHAPVTWLFARELLAQGAFGPCGQGDVRIWPVGAGARRMLCIALAAPDGQVLLQAPSAMVERWLQRTYQLVPPGHETRLIDVEQGLRGLLGESA